jgi:hypothetical protein
LNRIACVLTTSLLVSSILTPNPTAFAKNSTQATALVSTSGNMELVPKWTYNPFQVQSSLNSISLPVTSADGTLYVSDIDYSASTGYNKTGVKTNLFALHPDGTVKWRLQFDSSGISQPCLGSDGTLFVVTGSTLRSIHPDGSTGWSVDIKNNDFTGVVYKNGTLYVVSQQTSPPYSESHAVLTAYDAKSGQLKMNWVPPSPIERIGSLVVGNDGTIYTWTYKEKTPGWSGGIRDNKFSLYAVSRSGQIVWQMVRLSCSAPSLLLGSDGTFYAGVQTVPNKEGSLFAFDKSGNIKWQFMGKLGLDAPGCYKDREGNIYIDDIDSGQVRRMNPKNGTEVWSTNNGNYTTIWQPDSPFPEVGTYFLAYIEDNHNDSSQTYLGGFDMRTGKECWRILIPDIEGWSWRFTAGPDGTVYILLHNTLMAYQLKSMITNPPSASNFTVRNNVFPKSDSILVKGLKSGDVVRVYNARSGGKIIASGKASQSGKGTYSCTMVVRDLGAKAGKIYVTVTSPGLKESGRTEISYGAAKK